MLACGGACQDLANDPTNCGSCGVVCENMESCIAGRCLSAAVLREASWIGAAEQVSGGNPEATCRVDGELAPQKSLTAPHAITMFAGYARVSNDNSAFTYAIPLTPWSGVVGGGILAPLGWTKAGDNWTTSSPNNGYEYLTSMLMNTTAGTPYVGIAASLGGDIASSVWTNNFTPVEPSVDHKVDGPTACFDQGGTDLWIAAVDGHSNAVDPQPGVDAYLFRNCTGVPNSAGCLLTKRKRVYGTYDGHATVTVQPSTHSAIIGHREGGSIWLHIMEHDFPYTVHQHPVSEPTTATTACTDAGCFAGGTVPQCGGTCGAACGGTVPSPTNGCMRTVRRVNVSAKCDTSTGRCYAYVAFDQACGPESDGGLHVKARLTIVDVTDEAHPFNVASWISSACGSSTNNDFYSNVVADYYTHNVGWFWYRQTGGDGCNTDYRGATDTSLGLTTMAGTGRISLSAFKTVLFRGWRGLGDYTAIEPHGLGGGFIFPTWAQSVQLTGNSPPNCSPCQSKQYSDAVFGALVIP